jgi:CRP-like cAMP-binding protein
MPRANRLFESLGSATKARLRPYTELVHLAKGRVLSEPGDPPRYAYFPLDGLIALLGITEDGRALEVATAGADGLVGTPLALNGGTSPYQVMVHLPGAAQRIRGDAFARECQRCEDLSALALTYAHREMQQVVEASVCHAFHPLPQRVCRWLLVSRDCVHANTIALTQESIAHALGVSRSKLSQALGALEARHLILQGHGRIHILDPHGVQAASCPCYQSRASIPVQQPLRHAT